MGRKEEENTCKGEGEGNKRGKKVRGNKYERRMRGGRVRGKV